MNEGMRSSRASASDVHASWLGAGVSVVVLAERRRERTAGARRLRRAARALEGVGTRAGHRRAQILERLRRHRAPADLHAEAAHHLRLERVGEHGDPEAALRTAEGDRERALVGTRRSSAASSADRSRDRGTSWPRHSSSGDCADQTDRPRVRR